MSDETKTFRAPVKVTRADGAVEEFWATGRFKFDGESWRMIEWVYDEDIVCQDGDTFEIPGWPPELLFSVE